MALSIERHIEGTATSFAVVVARDESESKRFGYREGLDTNRMQSQTSAMAASPSNELCVRLCIPKGFSSLSDFTRLATPPQYQIAELKKIPSERQYPRFERRLVIGEP